MQLHLPNRIGRPIATPGKLPLPLSLLNQVQTLACSLFTTQPTFAHSLRVRFHRSQFVDADLRNACFFAADLSQSIFSNANIDGIDLRNSWLHRVVMQGLSMHNTLLDGADFCNADLKGCDLEYVRFGRAN